MVYFVNGSFLSLLEALVARGLSDIVYTDTTAISNVWIKSVRLGFWRFASGHHGSSLIQFFLHSRLYHSRINKIKVNSDTQFIKDVKRGVVKIFYTTVFSYSIPPWQYNVKRFHFFLVALQFSENLGHRRVRGFGTIFSAIVRTPGKRRWPVAGPLPTQDNTTQKDEDKRQWLEWNERAFPVSRRLRLTPSTAQTLLSRILKVVEEK
jgi:hypothetical protein